MGNYERFQAALVEAYRDLFVSDPEYAFAASRITPEALADKMTASLLRGGANKDGAGIKRVCKALGVRYTYDGIRAFLKGGG